MASMPKKNYRGSWHEKPAAAEVRRSASKLAQAIATIGAGVLPKHKYKLLSFVVWIATEANGKYDTRYVSEAIYKGMGPVQHEHVLPIKYLVGRMLERPGTIAQVLDGAIACLVTVEEHRLLTNESTGQGWDRYRRAGIRVFDRLEGKWLDFKD